VFILDRLPFQPDGIRYEDEEIAEFLHQWILKDYIALGYEVVKVPITSTEKRLAFILKRLSDQGLI
jgi:predicted ATPase